MYRYFLSTQAIRKSGQTIARLARGGDRVPGLLACVRHEAPCRGAPEGHNTQLRDVHAEEKAVPAPPGDAPAAGLRRGGRGRGGGAGARAVGWPCPGRVRRGERAWTSFSDRSSRTPYTGEPACRQPRLAAPGDCVPLRAPSWFRKDRWPLAGSSHARTPRTRARAHRHARPGQAREEGRGIE